MMSKDRDNTEELEGEYYREITRYPLLTREEEVRYGRLARKGDEKARKKLILSNLRLVIKIAKSYSNYGVPLLDLIEEGNIGLIKAVSRFDPEKGFRFSTYASWWIRQTIVRAISYHSKTIRIPIHIFQYMNKYISLEKSTEKSLTISEKAKKLDISVKKCKTLERLISNIKSMDISSSLETYHQLKRQLDVSRYNNPEEIILKQLEYQHLIQLMEKLSEREKLIIRIRYGFEEGRPHTLAETGKVIKVSRERVRQLEKRALKKLKSFIEMEEV